MVTKRELLNISIIIPTFNEADQIGKTIRYLLANGAGQDVAEIIVADGGSTEKTVVIATEAGAKVINCKKKDRATQMNEAALAASNSILYFLHADTVPPENFFAAILQAIESGYGGGCFRLAFDYQHWFLKVNCWFTRFDLDCFRFGDQSLFVRKSIFLRCGGFDESKVILEDQEIIGRIKRNSEFIVIDRPVITSARKYLYNGVYKTQMVFYLIYALYCLGFSQKRLVQVTVGCFSKIKFSFILLNRLLT